MPMHFAEARANTLTNDAGDAVTGTAEYKVCAVRIAPALIEVVEPGDLERAASQPSVPETR